MDYMFRWLALKFLPAEEHASYSGVVAAAQVDAAGEGDAESVAEGHGAPRGVPAPLPVKRVVGFSLESRERGVLRAQSDAPRCHECGSIMVRNGACYKCLNCGSTSGCS